MRIDEQVFFTMAGICIFSLIVFAFRYATREDCFPIKIQIPSGKLIADNRINFKAETKGAKTFAWNFGDGNVSEQVTSSVSHSYKKAGIYTVKVLINGKCSEMQNININEAPVLKTESMTDFTGPATAFVNEPVTFEDTYHNSTSWEWRFEEGDDVRSTQKRATHTYMHPGRKKVQLKVNGKQQLSTWRYIDVYEKDEIKTDKTGNKPKKPRPGVVINQNPEIVPVPQQIDEGNKKSTEEEKPPAKPRVPEITRAKIEEMFMDVVDNKKTVNDFLIYLCDASSMITYEGKFMTIAQVCEKLKGLKTKGFLNMKVKKINVSQSQDAETNCITITSIIVKKERF